jgi:hypothetical protein
MFVNNRSKGKSPGFIPGNPNLKSNLVYLTLREHFICHWLLTKMVAGAWRYKMERALHYFRFNREYADNKLSSLEYARAKSASRNALLGKPGTGGGRGIPRPHVKVRIWCNNGVDEICVAHIPEGWTKGRIANKGKPDHNKGKPSPHRGIKKGKPSPCRGRKHTDEVCELIRLSKLGKPSPLRGIKNPSCGRPGVPKKIITCPHCGKSGGEPQIKRWHFDKCKW